MSTLELKAVQLFYPEIGFYGILERKKSTYPFLESEPKMGHKPTNILLKIITKNHDGKFIGGGGGLDSNSLNHQKI